MTWLGRFQDLSGEAIRLKTPVTLYNHYNESPRGVKFRPLCVFYFSRGARGSNFNFL
jgi:hypothetical protein